MLIAGPTNNIHTLACRPNTHTHTHTHVYGAHVNKCNEYALGFETTSWTSACTKIQAWKTHTHTHTHTHYCTHTDTHAHTHTHTQRERRTQSRIQSYTQSHTHARTHTMAVNIMHLLHQIHRREHVKSAHDALKQHRNAQSSETLKKYIDHEQYTRHGRCRDAHKVERHPNNMCCEENEEGEPFTSFFRSKYNAHALEHTLVQKFTRQTPPPPPTPLHALTHFCCISKLGALRLIWECA